MNKEFVWDDATIKKLLHAATGNIKDFVMDNDGFLEQFKTCHTPEVKRDWEIIEFEHVSNNVTLIIPKKYNTGLFTNGFEDMTEHICLCKGYPIRTVRRLSDNEVFSVGDKIKSIINDNNPFTIEKIQIINNDFIYLDSCPLSKATKSLQRTPLFKDFNGNQVYVGDDFFIVAGDDWRIHNHTSNQSDIGFWKGATTFNSRESAEQYILMNKPCLSVNDVCDWYFKENHNLNSEWDFKNGLKELAKQRLNKQ